MRERRKAPRFAFGITGLLHRPGEMVGSKVVVRIISTVGCAIEGARDHAVGKGCEIYFDWNLLHVGVAAEVVSQDSTGRTGLKFLSIDREMQARLKEICDALRERALAVGSTREQEALALADAGTSAREAAKPVAIPAAKPQPAKKSERRKVPRYASDLPVQLSSAASGADSDVMLITLSVLGGCLEGSGLPEADLPCELTTEWNGRPLQLATNVIWKRGKRIGFVFTSLTSEAEKALRQICSGLRMQPMAAPPPEP